MECPKCGSHHIRQNGRKQGKQNHICIECGRQFIDVYNPSPIYKNHNNFSFGGSSQNHPGS